eukprot:6173493-Pleurochrysis_carterae.AAC.2
MGGTLGMAAGQGRVGVAGDADYSIDWAPDAARYGGDGSTDGAGGRILSTECRMNAESRMDNHIKNHMQMRAQMQEKGWMYPRWGSNPRPSV